jgi:phosphoribosylformylglycinamidine cyclo-ligase
VLEQVNYNALDRAKNAFIEASKKTTAFAQQFGFVPNEKLGASANIFALNLQPFLASSIDKLYITLLPEGLGTADDARPDDLNESQLVTFWHNIAIKCMSCMTNDAASGGMQTILISLYLPSASPQTVFNDHFLKGFLDGFVDGCKTVGCVWISGETPQLKGKIYEGKLDIAGALFALVPPNVEPIDGSKLTAGNKIVFVASSGPHENGFTALRKLATQLPDGYHTKLPNGQEYWEAINAPSVLYTPLIQKILRAGINVTSVENVTGHGWQKLMRSKRSLRYVIKEVLPIPTIFEFVEQASGSTTKEMLKIFNYGVGLAIYVASNDDASEIVKISQEMKMKAIVAGNVLSSNRREIVVEPLGVNLTDESFLLERD